MKCGTADVLRPLQWSGRLSLHPDSALQTRNGTSSRIYDITSVPKAWQTIASGSETYCRSNTRFQCRLQDRDPQSERVLESEEIDEEGFSDGGAASDFPTYRLQEPRPGHNVL